MSPNVEISDPKLRALAKLSLAVFIAQRQGIEEKELGKLEKDLVSAFAAFHGLDKDAVSHFYLQALETLSRAPFVFCAIHSRREYIDAVIQNPTDMVQVVDFVVAGLESVQSDMNFKTPQPDLIIP